MSDCWGCFGIVMVGRLAQAGLGLQSFRLAQFSPCHSFGIMSSLPLKEVARWGLGRFAAFGPPTRNPNGRAALRAPRRFARTLSIGGRKGRQGVTHNGGAEAKPTDRAAGELRDALAKAAKRPRQGRRNFFPLT